MAQAKRKASSATLKDSVPAVQSLSTRPEARAADKTDISPPPLRRGRGQKRGVTEANGDVGPALSSKRSKPSNAEQKTDPVREEAEPEAAQAHTSQQKKPKTSPKKRAPVKQEDNEPEKEADERDQRPAKKRKTAAEKAADKMPLASRTIPHALNIGAHVSGAGGVHNVIENALHIGANSLACFLKSQRKWTNPDLKDEHAELFTSACTNHKYQADKHVVPHGSYLVNLAAQEKDKADQAYTNFLDDLKRCDRLGIELYNFHPGNTNGKPRAEALGRIAAQLNKAHKATSRVVTLLENMAAAPEANTIGGAFEDLREVIDQIEDKSRVGVCLDTCHAFAAGYDLRTPDAYRETMSKFDSVIGGQYLKAVHLNDSKGVFNSHRDLHQNIGLGFLGLRAFHNLINDPRFKGVPMVLETPIDRKGENGKSVEDHSVWSTEIKLLESLYGMDAESDEFKKLEQELSAKGTEERQKLQNQFDKKGKKDANSKTRRKKKAADTSDSEVASD